MPTKSAFVELAPTCATTPEMLYDWLDACHLVERVEWQSTKTSQAKIGKHKSERNIKMFPKQQRAGSATQQSLEFEVTCNAHMSDLMMFKEPPEHLVPHAWQILRDVCRGKELFPEKIRDQEQEDVQEEEEPAPGSASAEPRRKRTSNDAPAEEEEEEEEEGKRRAGGGGAKLC